ncbi:MAG: hypothetical protein QOF24_1852 [Verrucomicrobiota bacterium]|jgi:hypothetical protein
MPAVAFVPAQAASPKRTATINKPNPISRMFNSVGASCLAVAQVSRR